MTQADIPKSLFARTAAIYVRQSDGKQLINNPGSTAWQMAQSERAIEMGWPAERVEVFADLGKSALYTGGRPEFFRMLDLIGQKKIGMVFIVDGTRMARNHTDWAALLDIASISETWIYCNRRACDPNHATGVKRLGMIQTRAISTGKALRRRLDESRLRKAQQGKAIMALPTGYIYKNGRIHMTDDPEIQRAIGNVFSMFDTIGSAIGVARSMNKTGMLLPRQSKEKGESYNWVRPTVSMIAWILNNPRYTGTYVFGRRYIRKIVQGHRIVRVLWTVRVQSEWPVCIKDAFPAYISWEKYELNGKILKGNRIGRSGAKTRESSAILSKIVKCGVCGKSMSISYGRNDKTVYICNKESEYFGGNLCQNISGGAIDKAILQAISDALSKPQIKQALSETMNMKIKEDEKRLSNSKEIKRLINNVEIAKSDYLSADRRQLDQLLLEELEQDWKSEVTALNRFKVEISSQSEPDSKYLKPELFENFQHDYESFWMNTSIGKESRNKFVRSFISHVTILKITETRKIHIVIHWHSGKYTAITIGDEEYVFHGNPIPESTVNLVLELGKTHDKFQISKHLNALGIKAGKGRPFQPDAVWKILKRHNVPRVKKHAGIEGRLPEHTYMQREAARLFGVADQTILGWWKEGAIQGQRGQKGKGKEISPQIAQYFLLPEDIEKIKDYMVERRSVEIDDLDRASFANHRMVESVWDGLKTFFDDDSQLQNREMIDALTWVFIHKKRWAAVSLQHQDLKTLQVRINNLKLQDRLAPLADRLVAHYHPFDAEKLKKLMIGKKNHDLIFFPSLKEYLDRRNSK